MQVLLQLPFDLSVSVLEATKVPLERCLLELPSFLHSVALCAHHPSIAHSQAVRILGPHDSTKFCSISQPAAALSTSIQFAKQPHQFALQELLRALQHFNLQELLLNVSRTSLRCATHALACCYCMLVPLLGLITPWNVHSTPWF